MSQKHPDGCHEDRIIARIPPGRFPHLKDRLRKAAKKVHVNQSVLVLAAVEAACEEIEHKGKISLPIKLAIWLFGLGDFILES